MASIMAPMITTIEIAVATSAGPISPSVTFSQSQNTTPAKTAKTKPMRASTIT